MLCSDERNPPCCQVAHLEMNAFMGRCCVWFSDRGKTLPCVIWDNLGLAHSCFKAMTLTLVTEGGRVVLDF